jgi:hypothetical protein
MIQDPLFRVQFSRQQDLKMFWAEQTSSFFRNIATNFQIWERIQPNDHTPTFSKFSSETKPSEDTLPILW